MPVKNPIEIDKDKLDKVKVKFNETREPENDWQILLKTTINQVMDDYIRLQHPTRRDQHYLKEAFCSAISCLWDKDYTIIWPTVGDETIELSFRDVLAQRFGLDNLDPQEVSKINLGPIQDECIKDAKEYWLDKQLNIVQIPDFFVFEGRAFSIWKTKDKSSIDYDNCIINLHDEKDEQKLSKDFLELCLQIGLSYSHIIVKDELVPKISDVLYQMLRMNNCFSQNS